LLRDEHVHHILLGLAILGKHLEALDHVVEVALVKFLDHSVESQLPLHQVEVVSRDAEEWIPSAYVLHHSGLVVGEVPTSL